MAAALATASLTLALPTAALAAPQSATGRVFHDANNNEKYDDGEPGLADIRVSNGRDIVKTDAQGRYTLPIDDDTNIFVIKPQGWRTAVDANQLPQYYYIHKPAGSPKTDYPGIDPTGPLPASVDFPLYQQDEAKQFEVILFTDPQPRDIKEVEYLYHDIIADLIGDSAAFGVTLGDIAFNNLETLEPQNEAIGKIGLPWYNVIGNHDLNFDSPTDADSDETFHRLFGPNYYSFDYSDVHFIVIDNIYWERPDPKERGGYKGRIDDKQLEFIKNDLALLPPDQMVVLLMHIPITDLQNKGDLFRLIENRPHCISMSGHAHYQEHRFINERGGWKGDTPHHHIVNVTACGSWWAGAKDETGIPHATMRDGAPNGYARLTLGGTDWDWTFVPARKPADYQMNIWAPNSWKADGSTTEVIVNVFGGSRRSTVEMRIGDDAEWKKLKFTARADPFFDELKKLEKIHGELEGQRNLPAPMKAQHIWTGHLPKDLVTGTHRISVRTTDIFGKQYTGERLIRVE